MIPEEKTRSAEDNRKTQADSPPSAGGFLLAVGCIAGAIVGGFFGQPSIGFLGGLALGALAALAIWMRDRAGH